MRVPNTLTVPLSAHKIAQITPITEINSNPLLMPALLTVSAPFLTETFVFLIFNLTRPKARFTKAFSEADAGVVGIDSTNAQSADENGLGASPSSRPFSFSWVGMFIGSHSMPKHDQKSQY